MQPRGPYEGDDDYIQPSSAQKNQAPPQARYPSDHPSDSDDDRRRARDVNAAPYNPNDYGGGARSTDQFADSPERFGGYGPGMDTTDTNSRPVGRSDRYSRIGGVEGRDTTVDSERYTTIPVTSATFDEHDEAYLQHQQHQRLEHAWASRSQQKPLYQPRSTIQTRTSMQPRSSFQPRSTLTTKHEEARGFTQFTYFITIVVII